MRLISLLALAACSSSATSPPPVATSRDADHRRWLAGDLHMHVAPIDSDVDLTVPEIAEAARQAKLDFVVLTPHLWGTRRGAQFDEEWRAMAREARATKSPTLIPGVEWTTPSGHFNVAGVDVTQLGPRFLASADQAGAFITVNHPFAVPTKLPVAASHFDMSYRAWTGKGVAEPIDGVEVWNLPLALANVLSRPGGRTGEEHAWLAADRIARSERRRITAVAGTDNHAFVVLATTWVLAIDTTEAAILEALRVGATCIGGPEAGSFRARGDDGAWHRIGGIAAAAHTLTLAWEGIARLIIDGVDHGEHIGGFTHATAGLAHTYRIVVGASRSGFIYANL